eukprot:6197055-Pleurochrysis_carterae.AAC.4
MVPNDLSTHFYHNVGNRYLTQYIARFTALILLNTSSNPTAYVVNVISLAIQKPNKLDTALHHLLKLRVALLTQQIPAFYTNRYTCKGRLFAYALCCVVQLRTASSDGACSRLCGTISLKPVHVVSGSVCCSCQSLHWKFRDTSQLRFWNRSQTPTVSQRLESNSPAKRDDEQIIIIICRRKAETPVDDWLPGILLLYLPNLNHTKLNSEGCKIFMGKQA